MAHFLKKIVPKSPTQSNAFQSVDWLVRVLHSHRRTNLFWFENLLPKLPLYFSLLIASRQRTYKKEFVVRRHLIQCDQMLEAKSSPIFWKTCPKSSHSSFSLKVRYLKITQNSTYIGLLLPENLSPRPLKIAQSGHTCNYEV